MSGREGWYASRNSYPFGLSLSKPSPFLALEGERRPFDRLRANGGGAPSRDPPRRGEVMGVGDGDGERVGRVGAGDLHSRQEALDHGVDLRLLRAAGADHRLLDQPRRIFADRDGQAGGGEENDSAGLAELQRRLGIVVDEHLLDRGRAGPVLGEDGEKAAVQLEQPGRQLGLGVGADLAVGDMG